MKAKPCGDLRAHDVLEVLDYIEFFWALLHFCVLFTVCEEVGGRTFLPVGGRPFLPVGGSSSMWESQLTAVSG